MNRNLFNSTLRPFFLRILAIESVLALVIVVTRIVSYRLYMHDACNFASDIPCVNEASGERTAIIGTLAILALALVHITSAVTAAKTLRRKIEPAKAIWRDAVIALVLIPLLTYACWRWQKHQIPRAIRFYEDANRAMPVDPRSEPHLLRYYPRGQ